MASERYPPVSLYKTLQEEEINSEHSTEGGSLQLSIREISSVPTERERMQQVITQQPTSFNPMCLDPTSQGLYNTMPRRHMSGENIVRQVSDMGNDLLRNVQGKFVSIKSSLSYQDLIQGLIYNGENIVSRSPHLQYNSLVITDENGIVTEAKVGGIAMLTDKRLLFLSSQYFHKFSLSQFGDPKNLPGGYSMEMSCQDSTYYTPISLHLFQSLEIDGKTGVSGSIPLHASAPPCCGLFGICGCLKGWSQFPMIYNEFNEMKLRLGVLKPPWDRRAFINIHVNPEVPTVYVRDFTSMLQTHAKNLK